MYQELFESSPDAIIVADLEGRVVLANPKAEAMFGYQREEFLSQNIELLVPERMRALHQQHFRNYRANPGARPLGIRLKLYARRKDGSEFPVDITLSPIETPQGMLVASVLRDDAAHERFQRDLESSEERFRLLVDGVKEYSIIMLDTRGYVTSWNSGAEMTAGYRAEEIVGQHFSKFYSKEDVERGKPEAELKAAADRGQYEDEGWRVRKDGSPCWTNSVFTALKDKTGAVCGFSVVSRDLTKRRQAEESLLLEVTNILVSNLDIRQLLHAVFASLQRIVPHDFAGLALYDPAIKKLRLEVLRTPYGVNLIQAETLLPLEGSPAAQAFTTRRPVIVQRVENGGLWPDTTQPPIERVLKSACWLPLVSRARPVGCLVVACQQEGALNEKDVTLLTHVAGQVAVAVDNALAYQQIVELKERLVEEKDYLEEELHTEYNFEEIVGQSRALKRVLRQVERVAPSDATVLILGETGTGKELAARAIHDLSPRRERTFVKINCAAIPTGLLESELFGHEKGAFTGALTSKIGRLELAHQGTLFLDEVGDIPLELQPKLLRALEEKEFERLGSTRTIPVDLRLIAATNRDLHEMIKRGEFRSDLYYRLSVFPIRIPALRDRVEDIPMLAHYFLRKHARRMNKPIVAIPPKTMRALEQWSWPGNIRELENIIERAVILSKGTVLQIPTHELRQPEELEAGPGSTLEAAERRHILRAIREARGVVGGLRGAAAKLGLKRTTLAYKMKKLGISRRDL